MWAVISRPWRNRLFVGASIGAVSYVFAVLLRFDPQPLPYAVALAVVLSLLWLVLDIADEEPTEWTPAPPTRSDRVDEATSDLRVLSGHQQASVPTEALRDRLVVLAEARDPALADALRHELAPVRRISPDEIDRILTRIEEVRDHS